VRKFRPEVPLGLQKIVSRMLAKQPSDRYRSCAAVAEHLMPYAHDARLVSLAQRIAALPRGDLAAVASELTDRSGEHPDVRSRRGWLIAAAASVGASLTAWGWTRREPPAHHLKIGEWRPLVPVLPPVTYPHEPPVPQSAPAVRVQLDNRDRTLIVDASREAFIDIGQPVNGRFAVRAAMARSEPAARFGVFFRHRPYKSHAAKTYPYQVIELVSQPSGQAELLWSRYCYYEREDHTFRREQVTLAGTIVPLPRGAEPGLLELALGNSGLPEVAWLGRPLKASAWELSFDGRLATQVTRDQLREAFLGRLGLFAQGTGVRFSDVQLAYLA
jgi:hypothetical protein